jgi:RimJ/RimL family protein N-acetyltransferase
VTSAPRRIVAGPIVLELHGPDRAAEVADLINANIDHLRPWMPWAHRSTNTQEQAMRLAFGIERAENDGDATYSIVDARGAIIGGCGLHDRGEGASGTRDIGYWIAADASGHGYVTAAAGALTHIAFEVYGCDAVRITCDEANVRSAAVPERLGFAHLDTIDEERSAPADTNRTMVWVMTKQRWADSRGSRLDVSYA